MSEDASRGDASNFRKNHVQTSQRESGKPTSLGPEGGILGSNMDTLCIAILGRKKQRAEVGLSARFCPGEWKVSDSMFLRRVPFDLESPQSASDIEALPSFFNKTKEGSLKPGQG